MITDIAAYLAGLALLWVVRSLHILVHGRDGFWFGFVAGVGSLFITYGIQATW